MTAPQLVAPISTSTGCAQAPRHPDPSPADLAVLHRAQAGDPEAFDALYGQHHRGIFNYAYRLSRDPHQADDITADTFLKAWLALTEPGNAGHEDRRLRLTPWLYRIATNVYRDWFRRGRGAHPVQFLALQRVFSPESFGISAGAAGREALHEASERRAGGGPNQQDKYGWLLTDDDAGGQPERAALDAELRARVRAALDAIPSSVGQRDAARRAVWRDLLVLREWGDLTYLELAAATGLSVPGVKSMLLRARSAFREAWESQNPATEGAQDA